MLWRFRQLLHSSRRTTASLPLPVRWSWADRPMALRLRQTLQRLNLVVPILHVSVQRSALCGCQSPGFHASEQFLLGTAVVGLGVAQVRALDKTKTAMPGLTGGIRQLVTTRQRAFAGLV